VKSVGIGVIIVIVLVGLMIARLVTKLITRLVVLIVVVVLAVVVYQQRDRVVQAADNAAKRCEASFFGIHVQPHDPTVRQACQQASTKLPKK
jgi:hypothetical protein